MVKYITALNLKIIISCFIIFEGKLSAAEARNKLRRYRKQDTKMLTQKRMFQDMDFIDDHIPKIKRYINIVFGTCLIYDYNIYLCRFKAEEKMNGEKMQSFNSNEDDIGNFKLDKGMFFLYY